LIITTRVEKQCTRSLMLLHKRSFVRCPLCTFVCSDTPWKFVSCDACENKIIENDFLRNCLENATLFKYVDCWISRYVFMFFT